MNKQTLLEWLVVGGLCAVACNAPAPPAATDYFFTQYYPVLRAARPAAAQ